MKWFKWFCPLENWLRFCAQNFVKTDPSIWLLPQSHIHIHTYKRPFVSLSVSKRMLAILYLLLESFLFSWQSCPATLAPSPRPGSGDLEGPLPWHSSLSTGLLTVRHYHRYHNSFICCQMVIKKRPTLRVKFLYWFLF